MNKIEYDLNDNSNDPQGDEEIVFVQAKSGSDEGAIEFSKKVVDFLDEEIKNFNSENEKKIRLAQAKKMYCLGTRLRTPDSDYNTNEWGLARVNLFLRIISGNIEELNLDISKKTSYNKLMDITHHLVPTVDDLRKAKGDAADHELDYPYENIEELYIEETESSFYIDY